jgi:Uma2 family endonuclease
MTAQSLVLTYRDYAALPPDGRRHEIHDGALSVTPAPSPRHQEIVLRLAVALHAHVSEQRRGRVILAPVDVILNDTTVVQPDLVYLDEPRLAAISARGVEGAPTLVIEVLSPSSALIDRRVKPQLYARHGVPFYWLVDPEAQALEVYSLGPAGYDLVLRASGAGPVGPPPFTGLTLSPASIMDV